MAADGNTRTEGFPSGIVGVGLAEIERQIPLDEPPPLPPNAALAVIGKSIPRHNGRAKVTGAIRYTVDVTLPGMLCLGIDLPMTASAAFGGSGGGSSRGIWRSISARPTPTMPDGNPSVRVLPSAATDHPWEGVAAASVAAITCG